MEPIINVWFVHHSPRRYTGELSACRLQTIVLLHNVHALYGSGTGTEQHRHNTAEVAVYSVLSYFWALEAVTPYLMTKVCSSESSKFVRDTFMMRLEQKYGP